MGRRRWTVLAVAGGLVAVTALGACTGGDSGDASGAASGAGGEQAAPAAPAHGANAPAPQGSGGDAARTAGLKIETAKIRIAHMTVTVRHRSQVATQADAADGIATRAGGEVYADDRNIAGRHPTATLVLKVPPAALARVLRELSGLGHEVSRSLSTRDVTSEVADVRSRVVSARKAIHRLRVLYNQAGKVANVIAIEQELSVREADLESLEAQSRALTNETSDATITLALLVAHKHATAPPAKHTHGFLGGLISGWHAFVRGASWLVTALGAVLPFAALILVLALIARALRRRSTRRVPAD